jgi:hypothetical protein
MNPRISALVGLATLFILSVHDLSYAEVDTRPIEAVRAKTVLEAGDLQVIDEFIAAAVKDIVRTKDFSQASKARAVIIGKKGTQPQYAQQFSDSCRRHIAAGLEQAAANLPEDRKFRVTLNLLILADGLQDPSLAELGLAYLGNPNTALEYWAVRLVTDTATCEKIKQGNWPIGGQIIGRLQKSIRGSSSEVLLGMVAEFAAKLGTPEGRTLLTEVADLRITQHASGQVEDGQVDTTILKLLAAKFTSTNDSKAGPLASRFSQLFSYVIQRLAKANPPLDDTQRQRWISVIVEVEEKCLAPVLDNYQMPLRKAIEKSDMTALLIEHDNLLGSSTLPGQWVTKWQFDYGTGPDGKARTWPKELPAPRVTK